MEQLSMVGEAERLIRVGDMSIMGSPSERLSRALAAISGVLHPEFAKQDGGAYGDFSKNSCVLSSLTVRDFMRAIGYAKAEARPVSTILRARLFDKDLHSVGIGVTDQFDLRRRGRWIGHMVAVVPEEGWLIDTTLYPASERPHWSGAIGGMAAVPTLQQEIFSRNLRMLGAYGVRGQDGVSFETVWLDNPTNKGWRGPDAQRSHWRKPVVKAMLDAFNAAA